MGGELGVVLRGGGAVFLVLGLFLLWVGWCEQVSAGVSVLRMDFWFGLGPSLWALL